MLLFEVVLLVVSHRWARSAGRPNGMSVVAPVRCMELFGFTGMCACVCVCVRVKNRITSADLRVCACLTFVLWLVIAGNPSTSQSKKTIKQRFLKLLPCCKPSAAPSISQSKCSFTLYTSLLPSVSPDSSVKTHADTCGWMQSHTHTATANSLHINPHTETHSALKHCGIIASYWSELLSYSGIWSVLCPRGRWKMCVRARIWRSSHTRHMLWVES